MQYIGMMCGKCTKKTNLKYENQKHFKCANCGWIERIDAFNVHSPFNAPDLGPDKQTMEYELGEHYYNKNKKEIDEESEQYDLYGGYSW